MRKLEVGALENALGIESGIGNVTAGKNSISEGLILKVSKLLSGTDYVKACVVLKNLNRETRRIPFCLVLFSVPTKTHVSAGIRI